MNAIVTPEPIQVPWHVAVKTFRHQLLANLVKKQGMLPSVARKHLDDHATTYDPLIASIIHSAMLEGDAEHSLKQTTYLVEQYNKELGELMQDYPKAIGPLEALIKLYEDALDWDTEGRTFEGWVEMMKRYFCHEGNLSIDDYSRLKALADAFFKEDLRPFFDTNCGDDARDRNVILTKIAVYKDQLKRTKEQQ